MGQVAVRLTRRPPWWALLSSAIAPVALVAGWLVGAALQPTGYDPVRDTISALAADGATDRWVMTTGLVLLGLAHLVTAVGLRSLRPVARLVLGLAGVATLGVAVFEQPVHGSSAAHVVSATVGFVLLAVWPATIITTRPAAPWTARTAVALAATAVSVGLLVWFASTLGTGPLGLSERALSTAQALWPLVVVLSLRASTNRSETLHA